MRSAIETEGYFCESAVNLMDMFCRPPFSGRLKISEARIREPSQPPVEPWVLSQVPQSWKHSFVLVNSFVLREIKRVCGRKWKMESVNYKPLTRQRCHLL